MAKYGVVSVETAKAESAALNNEALAVRTLEILCDLGDGFVSAELADVYVSEMARRGLT